ncbi:serine protease [Flavobacterium sp. JAS]|uniref:S1 family peptidase n=1 Tax=Flavobacterium sp. JAS TaxID=2897329 RepID=UPI001E4A2208|nr:serine protease [Flavobacterium sp. JAS]MCD0472324.1 serine protease [Flavobacterium sp. JAS]
MRAVFILFFICFSMWAQDKDPAKVSTERSKLQTDKALFNSDATKKGLDESYIQIMQTGDALLKQDFDLAAKKLLLEDQQKGLVDAGSKEANNATVVITEKVLDSSAVESKIEAEISVKRLYGPSQFDSRIELLELDVNTNWQLELLNKSRSVAMIVEKENLHQLAKEVYVLDVSHTLGDLYGLCPNEAFYRQPSAGVGTCFIFSKNTMLTAAHVLERPITDYVIVFGYKLLVSSTSVPDYYFDKNDIYFPQEVLKWDDELDVIEFKVDRDFDRPVLEWENSSRIKAETSEIYMIGHPSGLPTKVALNAGIEENSHPLYYYTSLDSFQGNSGSPVFNLQTNKIIGILVAGEIDYKFNGNCYYSSICKLPYCKGEKVIRIEEVTGRF